MAESEESYNVVIVHYHLQRGGVTRVIESAVSALRAHGSRVLILSGEEPLEDFDADFDADVVRVISALKYRKTGNSVIADSLVEAMKSEAEAYFGTSPDVWHFHNPTLAKNVLMPSVVKALAEEGERIVLQIHDFAEDGRPGNYSAQRSFFDSESGFESTLYPAARHLHYATINQRDYRFLRNAGIKRGNVHKLPNAIRALKTEASPEDRPFSKGKKFALYPTRGIRRKNIGELLLLGLIFGEAFDFATTLSPENPDWKPVHDFWVEAVNELDLPVRLGMADSGEYDFLDLIGWSDFVVTTSIGEGFGLAFLEPWTAGKCVLGRDLPDVTGDFLENGLRLSRLYSRIDVPIEWLDEQQVVKEVESILRQSYLAYDAVLPKRAAEQAMKVWVQDGMVDFGMLNEEMQMSVLRLLHADRSLLSQMKLPSMEMEDEETIRSHRLVIESAYSLERYGEALLKLYAAACHGRTGRVRHLPPHKVLAQFLDPARLNLLRS